MPHPLRTLCAVSRTLVPWQPGVLPSLGDALVMDLRRAARHPGAGAEALRTAPWCAVVVLVEGTVPPADLAMALPHLPRGAAALVGSLEGETERLFQAIRRHYKKELNSLQTTHSNANTLPFYSGYPLVRFPVCENN